MDIFMKKATESTPHILGILKEGKLAISGRSFPEDSLAFFSSFNNWLDEFFKWDHDAVELEVDLDYMNTATEVVIAHLIRRLKEYSNRKEVNVLWKFESDDIDMKSYGEDLISLYGDIIKLEGKKHLMN